VLLVAILFVGGTVCLWLEHIILAANVNCIPLTITLKQFSMDGPAELVDIDAEAEANKRAAEAAAELERPVKKAKTEDAAAAAEPVAEQQQGASDVPGAAPPEAAADQHKSVEHTAEPVAGEAAAQHDALPIKASAAAEAPPKATPSPGPQHKARLGDVVYRVLVPARAVSLTIGRNVRELQNDSGARVQVGCSDPDSLLHPNSQLGVNALIGLQHCCTRDERDVTYHRGSGV
jgi:hypothetical protein